MRSVVGARSALAVVLPLAAALLSGCHEATSQPAVRPGLAPTTRAAVAATADPTPTSRAAADAVILPRGGEDVLARARELNSDRYAKPPTDFRPGHVFPRELGAKAITKTEHGFEVRLPSGAPVTTPTVYEGTVFVSGGFRSKEFYAFRATKGDLVWALNLDDDGPSTSACEDRVCVFNTESCTLFAVDAVTGKLLWGWWLGDPLMSAPAIAGGKVFTSYPAAGRHHGAGAGLHQQAAPPHHGSMPQASQLAPMVSPPGGAAPHPPGASHVLAAFDLKSGRILWQRWIDADVMSAPVAYGRVVYAASFAGTLYAFDQQDGTILAARAASATSAPVVARDTVYYTRRKDEGGQARETIAYCMAGGGGGGTGYSKPAPYLDSQVQQKSTYGFESSQNDAANGFAGGAPAASKASLALGLIGQGSVASLQAFQGSRLLALGGLNINSMGDEVVATDASGQKRWSKKLAGDLAQSGGFLAAPPIAAGGRVLVGTLAGEVKAIDPSSGRDLATYRVGSPIRSQPVVEDGWLYVGTNDGRLVAIDTGDRQLTGWTTWGRNAARQGAL